MEAGRLRHRITIQRQAPPETQNTYGEVSNAWTTLATVWAQVNSSMGNELIDKGQWRAYNIYEFVIRRRTDITAAMRLLYNGKYYNILSISEANVPIQMTLTCREVT